MAIELIKIKKRIVTVSHRLVKDDGSHLVNQPL